MSRNISVKLVDASNKSWEFTSLIELKKFLENENKFWNENKTNIIQPHIYFSQSGYLVQAINTINSWSNSINSWTDGQLQQHVINLQQQSFRHFRHSWLWSGHSYVPNFIEYSKLSQNIVNGFIEVILKNTSNHSNNYEYLKGYLLAYEFQMQGKSELTIRQHAEKQSYETLRSRLENESNLFIHETDTLKKDFEQYIKDTSLYSEKVKRVNNKLFIRSQKQQQNTFNSFMENSRSKINELENTYQEKLRLEKPASYWNKKASSYKKQGIIWSIVFTAVILLGIWQFGNFFSSWLRGEQLGLELKSLQGAVLFMTVITLYAILIKSISKMIFSSFHLQRDAEEREQLTHVYLSLTNENGAIDEDSRKIVLQALFSRADSGLLHRDSSPTMPGISELIKASRSS